MERGIIIPQAERKLDHALAAILAGDEAARSPHGRVLIKGTQNRLALSSRSGD
jgi:hypothetical protein